jgi:hypothetical protein
MSRSCDVAGAVAALTRLANEVHELVPEIQKARAAFAEADTPIATVNGVMITAALIATVSFAAMALPPGGFVPPPAGHAYSTAHGIMLPPPEEADVGHVVLRVAGHAELVKPLLALLYLSFCFALCALLLSLGVTDVPKSDRKKQYCCRPNCCMPDFRWTYYLANTALVASVLCIYGAFVCAAIVNFNFAKYDTWAPCTAVSGLLVVFAAFWSVFGPFSFMEPIAKCYESCAV